MSQKKPKINFVKPLEAIECSTGSNLMATLNEHEVPVASSCKGDGICGRCRIKVLEGSKNLSEINAREKVLRNTHNLSSNERISCQTFVNGDVTVDTLYW